jgi:hypothetical protein
VAGGDVTGVRLGGAIVSLVEPHPGQALAFHRWYERDHFYAGCLSGPGFFAGRRFVATRALKALRRPAGATPFGGPLERGTFLALYWLDADLEEQAIAWSIQAFHQLRDAGRIFAAADLVHAGYYCVAHDAARDADGVPAALALDHPFPGLALTLIETKDPDALAAWQREQTTRGPVALSVGLAPRPRPPGAVQALESSAWPDRRAWLHFLDSEPAGAFAAGFADHAARIEAAGVGRLVFAAPFLPTVPGTDRYADET